MEENGEWDKGKREKVCQFKGTVRGASWSKRKERNGVGEWRESGRKGK